MTSIIELDPEINELCTTLFMDKRAYECPNEIFIASNSKPENSLKMWFKVQSKFSLVMPVNCQIMTF